MGAWERRARREGGPAHRLGAGAAFAAQVAVVLLALLASLLITREYLLQRLDVASTPGWPRRPTSSGRWRRPASTP